MSIVEFNGPPSWSLDANDIGESTKYRINSPLGYSPPPPLPTGVLYFPQIHSHQDGGPSNSTIDIYKLTEKSLGDCEQSTSSTFISCGFIGCREFKKCQICASFLQYMLPSKQEVVAGCISFADDKAVILQRQNAKWFWATQKLNGFQETHSSGLKLIDWLIIVRYMQRFKLLY